MCSRMSEDCKSLILQDKCYIEIFLSHVMHSMVFTILHEVFCLFCLI